MTLPLLDITAPVPAGLDALLDSAALEVVLDEMRVEVDGEDTAIFAETSDDNDE